MTQVAAGEARKSKVPRHRSWTMWPIVLVLSFAGGLFWVAGIRHEGIAMRLERADSTADLLVTKAFWSGLDPYQDVYDLSDHFSIDYVNPVPRGEAELIHPRTPGSFILMGPLALLTPSGALVAMIVAGWVSVALGTVLLARQESLGPLLVVAAVAYGALSGPAIWSHAFGTQSTLLWGCLAVFVVAYHRRMWVLAGVVLAIAGTLKLFPLALIPLLVWRRRWKAVVACVGTLVLLNGTALMASEVSIGSALQGVLSSSANWFDLPSNISLAGWLGRNTEQVWVPTLVLGSVVVLAGISIMAIRRMQPIVAVPFLLTVALIASPLTWPHYILLLVPSLLPVLARARDLNYWSVGLFAGVLLTLPTRLVDLHLAGLVLIGVTLVIAADRIAAAPLDSGVQLLSPAQPEHA